MRIAALRVPLQSEWIIHVHDRQQARTQLASSRLSRILEDRFRGNVSYAMDSRFLLAAGVRPEQMSDEIRQPSPLQPDFYFENGLLVYTTAYHVQRGSCCGSGCRHCPYVPLGMSREPEQWLP